jgi:hypothetical protein
MRKIALVGVIVLLLIAAALLAGCSGSGTTATKSTSTGVSESSLGVPIYPGAQKVDLSSIMPDPQAQTGETPPDQGSAPDGSAQGSMPQPPANAQGSAPRGMPPGGPGGPGGNMTALWTGDPTSKVIAWYKQQLSGKTDFKESTLPTRGGQGQNPDPDSSSSSVMYSFSSGGTTKTVMIRANDMDQKGGTLIMVGDALQGMPSGPPGQNQNNQDQDI